MEKENKSSGNRGRMLLIMLVWAASGLIAACGAVGVVPGVPVKEYRLPKTDLEEAQQRVRLEQEEIKRLTAVSSNSVFTEKNGVPEYLLGPGDILTLTYWMPFSSFSPSPGQQTASSAEGFTQTKFDVTVRSDGKISYSFGDDIPAAGHTLSEVRAILLDGIRQYLKNPRLDVVVKEYKSKTALLFGRINTIGGTATVSGPGRYPVTGKMTVLDMINMAGGPVTGIPQRSYLTSGDYGGNGDLRKVELVRKGKKFTLNLYKALFSGNMSDNIIVDDGDMITVPEEPTFAKRVYVFGQVNSPGVFSLTDANDLLTAISLSSGTTATAVQNDVKIVRGYEANQGRPIVLSANLNDILKRGDMQQNIQLQDGDLVYVPRMLIGDINEFITNINPLMLFLTTNAPPVNFRSAWKRDQDWMKY